jgi:transposase
MHAYLENIVFASRKSLPSLIEQPYHTFVKRLQAYKFELRPDGAQRQQMRCFAGSCRFVYNKGLALQKARIDAGEEKLNYADLCKHLTQWRGQTETSWLKDAPTHPLQQALKDLERAYMRSRQRIGGPKSASPASPAVSRPMPTWSARSTFSGRDTPVAPVK